MKALHVFAMTIAATQFPPAIAQIGSQRPVEQIIAQAHAAFSNATSAKEIEAVELWCRDSLVLLSFRERDGLMASAISLLRDNEFEEANAAFERLRRYDQSNKNIDDHACKSDVLDEGRRQTLQAAAIVTLSKSEALSESKVAEGQEAKGPKDRAEAAENAETSPSGGRQSTIANAEQSPTNPASQLPDATSLAKAASNEEGARPQQPAEATQKVEPSTRIPAADVRSVAAAQSEPPLEAAKPATPLNEPREATENAGRASMVAHADQSPMTPTLSQPEAASSEEEDARSLELTEATKKAESSSPIAASVSAAQSGPRPEAAKSGSPSREPREATENGGRASMVAHADEPSTTLESPQPEVSSLRETASPEEEARAREPVEAMENAEPSSSLPAAEALSVPATHSQSPPEVAKPATPSAGPPDAAENAGRASTLADAEQSSTTPVSQQPEVTLLARTAAAEEAARPQEPAEAKEKAERSSSVPAAEALPPADEGARRLCAQGLVALAQGDIVGSRAYLKRAVEAGDVRALLALGETYDPATLARMGARGLRGDAAVARDYYAKALAAGVVAAAQAPRPEPAELAKIASIEAQGSAPASIATTENGVRAPSASTTSGHLVASAEPDRPPQKRLDRPIWILLSTPLSSQASGHVARDPWRDVASWNKTIGAAPGRSLWAAAEVASASGTNIEHHRTATRKTSWHDRVIYRYAAFRQFNKSKVSAHRTELVYPVGQTTVVPY